MATAKNTGYENGKKIKNSGHSKFYEGEYDISDFNELMYETIIEIYLEWLQRYDIHRLFKSTSCNIKAIIGTIMNCEETFIADAAGDMEDGLGMRLVTQEMLQKIIKSRHSINVEQENISKDLELMEQRLLEHLFYSLNYRIGKEEESHGIYEKESERFLCETEEKKYIKAFSRASYIIYGQSIRFINSNDNSNDFGSYFRTVKRNEDMVIGIVSLEKGKKKYDKVNLISGNDDDLVDDKKEDEFINNELSGYKLSRPVDWEKGYWEAELQGGFMNIKLWSRRDVKKPIQHSISKEKLMVYCGYMDFYFCNVDPFYEWLICPKKYISYYVC